MLFFLDKDLANTFQYFQKMCFIHKEILAKWHSIWQVKKMIVRNN